MTPTSRLRCACRAILHAQSINHSGSYGRWMASRCAVSERAYAFCMEHAPEMLLPDTLRSAACRSGNEWGWPPETIPLVIDAAETLGLLNVGGQLQFLMPQGTCECYWVDVDTYKSVDKRLPWTERVNRTAEAALRDFEALPKRYDFIAEGRVACASYLDGLVAQGRDPADSMCFVWYVLNETEGKC